MEVCLYMLVLKLESKLKIIIIFQYVIHSPQDNQRIWKVMWWLECGFLSHKSSLLIGNSICLVIKLCVLSYLAVCAQL